MSKLYNVYSNSKFLKEIYEDSCCSKALHTMVNIFPYCYYKFNALLEYLNALPRKFGFKSTQFGKLRELKNQYIGKRCFITCTGPSLTIQDLEKLKDEYVFGMNSICLIHEKTDWKPDFFGIQDKKVFEKVKETMLNSDNGLVFIPTEITSLHKVPEDWIRFHISSAYHFFELARLKKYFVRFSKDSYVTVYDGYSITYSLIQIAYYLGFNEVYLLGADCSYIGKQQHFIEHGHYDKTAATATDRLMVSYTKVKEICERTDFKVYNATRGGCLEIFPRVNLDEILLKHCKNKKYE